MAALLAVVPVRISSRPGDKERRSLRIQVTFVTPPFGGLPSDAVREQKKRTVEP